MPRRRLSEDETELWRRVARSARALRAETILRAESKAAPEIPAAPQKGAVKPPPAPPPAPLAIPPLMQPVARPAGPTARFDPAPSVAERLAAEPVRMDQGLHRAMMRGKLIPDARIDLHGMTVAQAHHALLGFVMARHARGDRLLLVITGKGRKTAPDHHAPMPARAGVLKHEVPIWLRQAPLGPLVLEMREAHRSQGGSGAYYVYLRKRAR